MLLGDPMLKRHWKGICAASGHTFTDHVSISAQHRLDNRDPKLEPDYGILSVIKQVELICHLWQQYVSIALLPLASSSIVVRRDMAIYNNQVISRIEGLTSGVLQRLVESTFLVTCFDRTLINSRL
jgi:hypothetical protein